MRIEVVTSPTVEPVTLAEAKVYCRIDSDLTDEDDLLSSFISVAREQLEVHMGRALAPQTLRLVLDDFPRSGVIRIPRPPLVEVESVVYDDIDGEEQEIDAENYIVNFAGLPGTIRPVTSWPDAATAPGSVRITYRCGYATPVPMDGEEGEGEAEAEPLPARARQAMLYMINHMYEYREPIIVGTISAVLPMTVQNLVAPLKIYFRVAE